MSQPSFEEVDKDRMLAFGEKYKAHPSTVLPEHLTALPVLPRKYRLADINAPRPGVWKGVINPNGAIEPPYVGHMYFDKQNDLFYRADGPTAYDWGLVTPPEMLGAMVQSFVDFCHPAHNAMSKAELLAALKLSEPDPDRPDHVRDARQIAELGLRVHDQRCWTAGDTRVAMARIRLEAPPPVALFVGFAEEPVMPSRPIAVADPDLPDVRVYDRAAVGVAFDDKAGPVGFALVAGQVLSRIDMPFRDAHVTVRVELAPGRAAVYLDDYLMADQPVAGLRADTLGPRVSFFRYGRTS